ncbi:MULTISPECIES: AgmX/PglI C-terminal domain-containing protein [Marinobacter]|uniref:AgmX/PglI C-terminal domain-containing protein n=1 Tax=Marinobacter suaedae TaxID=3057675 RepID=A0ABT8VY80_9GAMM|nr:MULTISPECIES: AgmX/PglI C-terminal domain-containing protein [unclassified Marinobacter]MBZ2169071.1 AgmX/PglI C-terminal domain-containing protein [Marinobacter sp. F4216]MDO3720940.1 AgmX/PglI C-terminal domain-containing protein [Marinobacter sp. chi1]
MTAITAQPYDFELPWDATGEEDSRFKRILKRALLLLLLLLVVFPWLPLPEIEREEKERVPPSLAKVLIEQRKVAPPPPPPEPVKQEEAKPEAQKKEAAPKPAPAKEVKKAREKVSKMGVAAFSNELASLRSSLDVAKLQAKNTNVKTGAAAKAARSVLGASSATKTSGGVSSSVMNDSGSGTQLAAHSSTAVESPIGGGTGAGGGGTGGGSKSSTVAGGRDMESIRRVFEQHKGAIYALYNRALRSDPSLKGKFVFHIVIEPSGSISSIKLVESQLGDKKLELKLLARIQMISFGPEDVAATPVNYKFDFMPG